MARVAIGELKAGRQLERLRQSGDLTRVLLYSPANLNVIDGSAVWVETVAATLTAGRGTWVVVPLKARERRRVLTDALRALDRVHALPVERSGAPRDRLPLDVDQALDWIERLDDDDPFDIFLLRGFKLCLAAAARPRFAGRLWSAYILEPERDPDSPTYQADMETIAASSRYVVTQTEEMRIATEARVPSARGRMLLLPPAIADSGPRADGRPVARLIYTGKFSPFYPVPDLIDSFARLRVDHPELEFVLAGDKIWKAPDDHDYADRLQARVDGVAGVVWSGGMSRADVGRLLGRGGIALSVWDYRYGSHWNDLVVSTKLLDYCAAGLPVILTRTPTQESILGVDYPLFVDSIAEVEPLLARVLDDDELYRRAGARTWAASRRFTYSAVHAGLAGPLAAAGRRRP